ncbi:MAG: hypothetical protein HOB73_11730 [Planctomycetaceae bacterium]|jgi:YHS domain-containing protein|nr:hypothetical protein [Planctomycetaceae bacterium]
MNAKKKNIWFSALAVLFVATTVVGFEIVEDQSRGKKALAALQDYVGTWKGAGQVRRGSTQGAWIEESEWVWQFDKQSAAIVQKSAKGKFVTQLELRAAEKPGAFVAMAKTPQGAVLQFAGELDDSGRLVLVNKDPQNQVVGRISIRTVAAGKRMIVMYEKRLTGTLYARLGELGSTRKGSMFGGGATMIECIVSGGKGTIPVTYNGKTYYVCCSGCRDYFNDNAAEVVAAAAAN